MKISQIALTVLFAAATSLAIVNYSTSVSKPAPAKETVYQRVMRTGVLRCGFTPWAPFFSIDPNTKEKSGIAYDYAQVLEKELDVKFEWVEEAGYGNFHEGLNSGRYDAMCTPMFESGQRAKISLLTNSLFENGLFVFVRGNDNRFDGGLDALNKKEMKFLTVDGDVSQVIKRQQFPQATEHALPAMVDLGQYMLNVASGKVDAGFMTIFPVKQYNQGAKEKLKLLSPDKPIHIFGNSIPVKLGEVELKHMLDSAINAVRRSGQAKAIVDKYESFFLLKN